MRLLITLVILSIGVANAGMYKCKDANGKTSYSQSPCATEEATQEMTVKKDKQPTVTIEEKLMRLKNDVAMKGIIREQRAKEQALIDRQNRVARNLKYNQKKAKIKSTYNESRRDYHDSRIDRLEDIKRGMKTYKGRRAMDNLIDTHEDLKRKYK